MSGDDLDSLLAGDYVILGSNIAQVLAGVLLLLYVERVTRNQRDWYKSSLAQAPEYSSHSDADAN
jgi:hypothetical protein